MSDVVAVALITAAAPTLTVLLTYWRQRRKLRQVYDRVNGAHNEALAQIGILQDAISAIIHEEQRPSDRAAADPLAVTGESASDADSASARRQELR